jgi:hypothetical protein
MSIKKLKLTDNVSLMSYSVKKTIRYIQYNVCSHCYCTLFDCSPQDMLDADINWERTVDLYEDINISQFMEEHQDQINSDLTLDLSYRISAQNAIDIAEHETMLDAPKNSCEFQYCKREDYRGQSLDVDSDVICLHAVIINNEKTALLAALKLS